MALSGSVFAVNPMQGLYGGILLGGNYTTSTPYTFRNPLSLVIQTGTLKYSAMGNGALFVGSRFGQLRVELEGLYNYVPYKEIQTTTQNFQARKTSKNLRLQGNASVASLFFNSFYDFYTAGSSSNFAPYIGVGVGYSYFWRDLKFYNNNIEISGTHVHGTSSLPAAQGILGVSYFLDDYTAFGLDYRYYSTGKMGVYGDNKFQVSTINLSFTGSFCA